MSEKLKLEVEKLIERESINVNCCRWGLVVIEQYPNNQNISMFYVGNVDTFIITEVLEKTNEIKWLI